MVTGRPVRNRTATSTAPLNGTCLRDSEYPASSDTAVVISVDTIARYRLLAMSRPAPVWKAPMKLVTDSCGDASPGPAFGLNAASRSQASGSRNQIPMRMMTHRDRRDWPGGTSPRVAFCSADSLRLTLVRTLICRPFRSLLRFLGFGQLGPELADVDDGEQRPDEDDGQRDGRAVPEGVELEGLDVHVDRQDGRCVSRSALRHHEDQREIRDGAEGDQQHVGHDRRPHYGQRDP